MSLEMLLTPPPEITHTTLVEAPPPSQDHPALPLISLLTFQEEPVTIPPRSYSPPSQAKAKVHPAPYDNAMNRNLGNRRGMIGELNVAYALGRLKDVLRVTQSTHAGELDADFIDLTIDTTLDDRPFYAQVKYSSRGNKQLNKSLTKRGAGRTLEERRKWLHSKRMLLFNGQEHKIRDASGSVVRAPVTEVDIQESFYRQVMRMVPSQPKVYPVYMKPANLAHLV